MTPDPKNTALVIGGGFAGMQASLVLAERGHKVVLVDKRPAIGGLFPLLDNQFPTQSCGVCFMACDTPTYCPFVQCDLHENVDVVPFASVDRVEGQAGEFRVGLTQSASCVDPEKCTDCGACEAVCPVTVPREFGDGLETRKAVFKYYPKAVAKAYVVDRKACPPDCRKCVEACDPGAIDLDAKARRLSVDVGAVILAPGADVFPASTKEEFGYGRYANVLSAVKFERMLAAGSPGSGRVIRPSDGKTPKSLAFVQCVGSRDAEGGQGHCSSVCCMFALKQAFFAKERHPDLAVSVYYMDLRAFGKDYEAYLRRAEALGIRFVRGIPSVIRQVSATGDLAFQVAGEEGMREDAQELVVLAAGFCQGSEARELAKAFGVTPAEGGFAGGPEFSPCETERAGVFTCGAFREPKDIPETTAEAACAAGLAARVLEGPGVAEDPDLPTPADFRGEAPQIGVVLCTCEGFNAARADFGALKGSALAMPGVSFVETVAHACAKAGMDEVRRIFAEREPNRLVLASCSHRIVEKLYAHQFRQMGVHAGVLEIANLREACLEGPGVPPAGQGAAEAALREAVRKAWHAGFGAVARESVERTVLVIGGGAAGMRAALDLAALGHSIHLVERETELGGNLRTARYTIKGGRPQELLAELSKRVRSEPAIQVHAGARVSSAQGRLGAFRTAVEAAGGTIEILHGAVVFATGASEQKPKSYGYGQSSRIVTQRELEQRLAAGEAGPKRVVMIQCVESREEADGCRPWCSRVCCTHAVKNALKMLETTPDAEVTVLYRDLRTYGAFEHAYRQARDAGVLFTPYDLVRRPIVEAEGDRVAVRFFEPALGTDVTLEPDLLVLAVGLAPEAEEARRLAGLYGVEVGEGGFFREKNPKAATTDFAKKGVYMAGLAHAPKHVEESLTQAGAAAARCSAVLAKGARRSSEKASYVVEKICSRCGVCVDVCPYGARRLDPERNVAVVDPILCEACGACTMACPNKAAQQYGFAPKQMLMGLDELLGG
ncbi:MAG: CoB--CoM heterodisulfide reductase iron-sulfur subunit A family protein [Deltaproteobacteria bacterium]|nr:CoB--CoM heterodisulfide reductase iron-sulfur subunit A family protein [Deltaproteobacteria bacterium]